MCELYTITVTCLVCDIEFTDKSNKVVCVQRFNFICKSRFFSLKKPICGVCRTVYQYRKQITDKGEISYQNVTYFLKFYRIPPKLSLAMTTHI